MKTVTFQRACKIQKRKMFAHSKFKPKAKPANSRNQFVSALTASGQKVQLNRSFDTAQKLLPKTPERSLKQTKLCVPRPKVKDEAKEQERQDEKPSCSFAVTKPPEFFLMPMPKSKPKTAVIKTTAMPVQHELTANLNRTLIGAPCQQHTNNTGSTADPHLEITAPQSKASSSLLAKNGRDMVALVGQVDFCLKMQKVHPELSALWDVYGKLLKIVKGKLRGEHILLLRSASGGPILQSIYYDFNNTLQQLEIGCSVRAIGRFVGGNRLQTFKLQYIDADTITPSKFTRIQNVTSFVLLQNKIKQK